jgi:ABC-type polysaccharide/polyol phosphate export permease
MPVIPGALFARNLVYRRGLLFQLVRRDFQQRFVGSVMGWLWGLIHPLVLMGVYTFVFSVCLKQELGPEAETSNYPLYLLAGMLPWLLFSETVSRSAACLIEHQGLITKTMFPAEVVPVSIFLSTLAGHAMAFALLVAATAVWLRELSPLLLVLPVYTALLGLLAVGIGWIVSALHVYLRDTAQVLTVVLTLWFWITPIFISAEQIPEGLRFLIVGNPLSYIVRAYRLMLFTTRLPTPQEFGIVTAYAAGTFILGGLFFRHMKRGFADVL